MYDTLKKSGIIERNGDIDKTKISAISGAFVQPFVVEVLAVTSNDTAVLVKMQEVLTSLYNSGRNSEFIEVMELLYAIVGLDIPEAAMQLLEHPAASSYFLFMFLADLDNIVDSYAVD